MNENFKTVILAEKPKQAKDYAEALGIKATQNGYFVLKEDCGFEKAVVTFAMGHLIEMATPDKYNNPVNAWKLNQLPFFPQDFEYLVTKSKQKQFNIVKRLLKNCNVIINATDYGREGSNIFYSILNEAGIYDKKILRYSNGSLVHEDIRKQFNNLESNEKDLLMFQEAKTRQISDWLVGMNLSSLYTNLFRNKGVNQVFSIGRVQTPTLFLIYQRQKEIENFVSKNFYQIEGCFHAANGSYYGKADIKTEDYKEIDNLFKKHNLNEIKQGKVVNLETKEKQKIPPKLFSLSLLQQKSSEIFKYSAKDTLNIAQSLYDKKILTYPRTDTPYITSSEFDYLKNNLESMKAIYELQFEEKSLTPRSSHVIDKVEEHHAIIPTSELPQSETLQKLSSKEKNILNLVVTNTLAMFASDYIYDETKVETDVNNLIFYSTGRIVKEYGWKKLMNSQDQNVKKRKNIVNKLPSLEVNEIVSTEISEKKGETKPPQYFNDKDLILSMKNAGKSLDDESSKAILKETQGLGTEATRADIIEGLIKRQYVEVVKHRYHVTNKGQALCNAVKGSLLASPEMTADWEQRLKEIGEGKKSAKNFLDVTKKFINKEISLYDEKMKNTSIDNSTNSIKKETILGSCPNCKGGQIHQVGKVFKCNKCNQVFFNNFFKKTLSKNQVIELIRDGKTKRKLKLKSKNDKEYEAFLKLVKDENKDMYIYKTSFS